MSSSPDLPARGAALAALAVRVGANVQAGQIVSVECNVALLDTAAAVAEAAYAAGARYVDLAVEDRRFARARAEHVDPGVLGFTPAWIAERYAALGEQRGAWIYLAGPSQPAALDGIAPDVAAQVAPPVPPGLVPVVNASTTNWTVVPVPSPGWAGLAHPDLPPDEALARLWDEVAHVLRLDEPDPLAAWEERIGTLRGTADSLTERRFDALHLSGPGTDLTVGLLPTSRWETAGQQTVDDITHRANLPTEEVFTAPDPERVDGTVVATRPLLVGGTSVEGLTMSFAGGRLEHLDAERSADALRATVDRDEGGRRLGELALVDRSGRVGELGTVFHSTLLDENAASHIALGSAYPFSVESDEDRERINASQIHVDVMVGSDAIAVDGIASDGSVTPLLRDGRWRHRP